MDDETLRRLIWLEGEVDELRRGLGQLGGAVAGVAESHLEMGQVLADQHEAIQGAQSIIATRRLVIRDADGRARMILTGEAEGGRIAMHDGDGRLMVELAADADGGRLAVHDAEGRPLVLIDADDRGRVHLADPAGESLTTLGGGQGEGAGA